MLLTALYCHVLPLRERPVTKTRTPSHVLFCDRRARQGTAFPVASALASACAARRVELTLYLVSTATTARDAFFGGATGAGVARSRGS